ncbi:hypothetical protein E8E12_007285 [Didymella heteroderae]|uniref:N-acetyltransferase domain-containing protein n=1 Tax=Didymella heteroderae TaxID=1769908 RepID=A0A9P5C0H6_9PLEO|nr:hypothetical protein E8E12_007285 [Didymella heteroderae]
MSIIVHDVSDNELHRACIIEAAAYAGSDLNAVLFPGPFPPDSQQNRVDQLIQMRNDDPTAVYMQAIDKASGRMIASSKWHIYKTPEETTLPIRKLEFGPGTNPEACMAFFGGMKERKSEIMGNRPHIYLHMLHTDPEYQGRGAGSALLNWGKTKADKLGLPIYLESSAVGHEFYKKHGFKDIEVMDIDFSPYGGPMHKQPLMICEASRVG